MNKKPLDLTIREAITLATGYAIIIAIVLLICGLDSIAEKLAS
jgi:hypothetical protein